MLYPNNKDIVQQYYDFAVRKAYKNLGFSIKDVRETILTFDDAKHLNEQKFDSVRGKLFTLFDFVIYDYFIKPPIVVRFGMPVTIRSNINGVQVVVDGIARDNGRIGQIIKVKNQSSGRIVGARVLDENTVLIEK